MYKHHEESIVNLINYFKDEEGVIALVLGGSVAKGCEREDSDLDALVTVTDEKYEELKKQNRISECISGKCTYEAGYFDVKYFKKEYLTAAAEYGSEPSRNAFLGSRCLFTKDEEILELVKKIPVFQVKEKQDKMLSFYSALMLNYHYFWDSSENDTYLRMKTAADIVLFSFRLLLQDNGVLFPCPKSLIQTVAKLEKKPENIVEKSEIFLKKLDSESREDFVQSILSFIDYTPPTEFAEILTRYTADNELWWYKQRPVIAEW